MRHARKEQILAAALTAAAFGENSYGEETQTQEP